MAAFGKELELIRKRAGFTQYHLAKELNLSRSHINRIESGERKANKELLLKISEILKLDSYNLNKLYILSGLEPEIDKTQKGFKICFHLALEFKHKEYLSEAEKLIEFGMCHFDSMIELHALLANLNLLRRNYEDAINANEETIRLFDTLDEDEVKKIGITKAEVIHNLGYVYFERGLDKIQEMEKLTVLNIDSPSTEYKNEISHLHEEIIPDLDKAIEKIENAFNIEPDNLHILDQLARLYYRKGDLSNENLREELLKKSVQYYEKLISFNDDREWAKKQEASIFLALALGKLNKIDEASRLINTVIVFTPLYYLGYFAKSCIFSINAKKKPELLNVSFSALEEAIKLNPDLKEDVKWEIDLYNLRFDPVFKNKFSKLIV